MIFIIVTVIMVILYILKLIYYVQANEWQLQIMHQLKLMRKISS